MTDIVTRLHVVRAHLRTGALGQREVWEEWLTEAADENERLRAQLAGIIEKGMDDLTMVAAFQVNEELRAEIDRLRALLQEAIRLTMSAEHNKISPPKWVIEARRALDPEP